MRNVRLDESEAGIKSPGRNNLRYTDCRKWRTEEPLNGGERGEWKNQVETEHKEKKIEKLRSLEKTSMLGKIEGKRSSEGQRMDKNLSKLWETVKDSLACCCPWGLKESYMI